MQRFVPQLLARRVGAQPKTALQAEPSAVEGIAANAADVPAKRTRALIVHQIAAFTTARLLRVPAADLDASVTSLAGTTVSGARGTYRSPRC